MKKPASAAGRTIWAIKSCSTVRSVNALFGARGTPASDLDANSFQHRPFLAAQVRSRGYRIVGFGRTWIGPIAIYSRKYKALKDLPEGANIAIPNDPANESRVLLLLQKAGAIKLKSGIRPDRRHQRHAARHHREPPEVPPRRDRGCPAAAHARRPRCLGRQR